jgi:hypothetical protein|tara:strand:+ start:993 stop:1238 length:246 start_codon:yes stop_codon:yes gene_type:complete
MFEWFKEAVESGFIQRRIAYYTILGLTVFFGLKTWEFIYEGPQLGYSGQDVAMIIAAAWLPMGGLTAHVFSKHKQHEKESK